MQDRWWERGACRGLDPGRWFPEDDDPPEVWLEAKSICASCPVLRECLYESILVGYRHGIWGGIGRDRRLRLAAIFRRCQDAGDFVPLETAIGAELDDLARIVSGWPDDRPLLKGSRCERCGEPIRPGKRPVDRNGPNATCGNPSTYNKGCRCAPCVEAKARLDAGRVRSVGLQSGDHLGAGRKTRTPSHSSKESHMTTLTPVADEPTVDLTNVLKPGHLDMPPGLGLDDLRSVALQIRAIDRNVQWWWGDFLVYLETVENGDQVVDPEWLDFAEKRRQWEWVASTWPPHLRITDDDTISWSHHRVLCAVETEAARVELLREAQQQTWSSRELEEHVKNLRSAGKADEGEPEATEASGRAGCDLLISVPHDWKGTLAEVAEAAKRYIEGELRGQGLEGELTITIRER